MCLLLIEGRGHELGHATNSRVVLEALGGEVPAEWPTQQIKLANAHGLHARPAKILAQLAKEFEGEVRVRVLETGESAVSAKSLSKLLSLGVRRGQTLEFIAEPSIAADALPALIAAVEQGLGEEIEPLPAASEPQAAPTPAAVAKRLMHRLRAVCCRLCRPRLASPSALRMCKCCRPSITRKRANRLRPSASVCTRPSAKCAVISKT